MQPIILVLIFSLIGISILFSLTFLPPQEIHSEKELSQLEENQNVLTSGIITRIANKDPLLITLDNNITIVARLPSQKIILGKKIQIWGTKEIYNGKNQLRAREITIKQ